MTEFILALIIAGLLVALVYERQEHSKQVKELTSKIMAKNLNEYIFSEAKKPLTVDQLQDNAAKDSDLVDFDEVSDEDLTKAAEKKAEELRKNR